MIDYLDVIRRDSARFSECLRNGDLSSAVPSCPDWTLADLGWHLTEVQHFWGSIVIDLLQDRDGVVALTRPADEEIADLFDERSARMLDAVSRHPADARCWTWDDDGWTVGWVRRRQAHEALIHRVDAEQAIGHVTSIDAELAADGVDEVLRVVIEGMPEWGTFHPDGAVATLAVDGGQQYGLRLGRFRGTGPESGTEYDFETLLISEPGGPVIAGSSVALDLWLWGRSADGVRCDDDALVDRIRAIAAEATQ
jgi:uncharacterized protein (TIGR03083 family)